jgi:hypothetical protein
MIDFRIADPRATSLSIASLSCHLRINYSSSRRQISISNCGTPEFVFTSIHEVGHGVLLGSHQQPLK